MLATCRAYSVISQRFLRSPGRLDPEMVGLIEWAFLEGQIDGLTAELAYIFLIWLRDKQGC